jgi:hypothetical protein
MEAAAGDELTSGASRRHARGEKKRVLVSDDFFLTEWFSIWEKYSI